MENKITLRACECGGILDNNSYSICTACRMLQDRFVWECSERADATPVLYSYLEDKYISYIKDYVAERIEAACPNAVEVARRYQIYLTEPVVPRDFDLEEYLLDCLEPEDNYTLPGGWQEAQDAVNDWLRSVPLDKWPVEPSNIAWNGIELRQEPPKQPEVKTIKGVLNSTQVRPAFVYEPPECMDKDCSGTGEHLSFPFSSASRFERQVQLAAAVQLLNRARHALMQNQDLSPEDGKTFEEALNWRYRTFADIVINKLFERCDPTAILAALFFRLGIHSKAQITVDFLNQAILEVGAIQ